MATSQINYCHNKECGLTLIEVLIALAIIAIALTAVIKATTQNIRSTSYLQEKMIALWVGEQVLNEARVGVLPLPDDDENIKEKTSMLGFEWYWQAQKIATPNMHIKKIEVNVFAHEIEEDEEQSPIIHLETYVYVPE